MAHEKQASVWIVTMLFLSGVMHNMLHDLLHSGFAKTDLFGCHAPGSPPTQASSLQLCLYC